MIYEKKKMLIYISISFVLLLFGIIIIPIIIANAPSQETEIVEVNGYINGYYESLDKTDCEIEVVFNTNVDSGYITVAFYDGSGKLLAKKNEYFYGYDNTLSSSFTIDGKVDSFEILDHNISAYYDVKIIMIIIIIVVDIFVFAFFISSLFLSCKVYDYNGNEIIIYAGWYHHYIKVNGTKTDEHNTLITFTAISLSCILSDGTDIKATISLSNRISLKINNLLYKNRK